MTGKEGLAQMSALNILLQPHRKPQPGPWGELRASFWSENEDGLGYAACEML